VGISAVAAGVRYRSVQRRPARVELPEQGMAAAPICDVPTNALTPVAVTSTAAGNAFAPAGSTRLALRRPTSAPCVARGASSAC
jgi:hypothetical protein